MRLNDRLIEENKRINKELAKEAEIQQDVEEDETGYAYADRPPFVFLNRDKGVFANPNDNALNTAPSIFDKTAIFRTSTDNGSTEA